MENKNSYVLIMAGGVGSRFWPKSRNAFPKQFIDVLGVGKSLLQLTYERFLKLCPAENIFIVTNAQYEKLTLNQLKIEPQQIISEPSRNNTAPCIAYASFKLKSLNLAANIVVAPSDHLILDERAFLDKITQALHFAERTDALVTLGISPTRPDSGYGYIRYEKQVPNLVQRVVQFTEKPNIKQATAFLKDGNYLWNAGIFVATAESILKAFKEHCNDIYSLFEKGAKLFNTDKERQFVIENYPLSPNISIDFAVMEKANNVYTIPSSFGWSDLGTWGSLHDLADKDDQENLIIGSMVHQYETSNSLIQIKGEKLALIKGLNDYIVVDEDDALLIYPKNDEQEIKSKVSEICEKYPNTYF